MPVFLFAIFPDEAAEAAKAPCLKILVDGKTEPDAKNFAMAEAKDNCFHTNPRVQKIKNVDGFELSENEKSRIVWSTPHAQ